MKRAEVEVESWFPFFRSSTLKALAAIPASFNTLQKHFHFPFPTALHHCTSMPWAEAPPEWVPKAVLGERKGPFTTIANTLSSFYHHS